MREGPFTRLEEVLLDELFPEVDVSLRQGRHIDRNDSDCYTFLVEAQAQMEPFYRRYGCELVHSTDGYFYLIPTGDQLGRRHLTVGEMLVGQTLALAYLDPATVSAGGIVNREQLLSRLAGLLGERELVQALNPRRASTMNESLKRLCDRRSREPYAD
jgi:chromosome partition protein MukE